jgi:hypothetical protein
LRALETASSQNEVFQAAVEQLHLGAFSSFDSVPVPIASFAALTPLPLTSLSRYARIKAMLLNAAAGSAASAMTELAFETALAAKHLQVRLMALPLVFFLLSETFVVQRCISECKRQYLVISALVSSERSATSARDDHVHTALQHASDSVATSLHFAMHFARCNVAIISRIFEKYEHAVACAVREGSVGISQRFLEQQFLQDDCATLLTELRVMLSPPPAVTESSLSEPAQPSSPARQPVQPSSPARLHGVSSSSGLTSLHVRSDSNAVLQAARSRDLPVVASISGGSSAALTGAVKSAVETNDTVALSVLLSTTTITGSPR